MLSQHFSLEEFTVSQHRGIDNSLPSFLVPNALETCAMLERIRAYLSGLKGFEVAVSLTSGYRCKPLNDAVGSKDTSDHLKAYAADFRAPMFGDPYTIAMALAQKVDELRIGQLIHEFGSWVHVGVPRPQKLLNRVITISGRGTEVGILRV